jgi:hypothetical protein
MLVPGVELRVPPTETQYRESRDCDESDNSECSTDSLCGDEVPRKR